jgi:hypothetical protein
LAFDGSGDYFRIGTQPILDVGTANFTVEFWLYSLGVANTYGRAQVFGATEATSGSGAFVISLSGSPQGSTGLTVYSSSTIPINYTTAIPSNTWIHVAVVRSGTGTNQTNLFINGNSVGSGTMATSLATPVYDIGALNAVNPAFSDFFNGFLDDFRITKNIARYETGTGANAGKMVFAGTNNFADPNNFGELQTNIGPNPDPNWNSVSLLLRNGALGSTLIPIDESPRTKPIRVVNGAGISTTVFQYGSSSLIFDGVNDYIFVQGASTDFVFGTGDFTIEFWVRFPVVTGSGIIMDFRPAGTGPTVALPNIARNGTTLGYAVNNVTAISGGTVSANIWHHVAVARSGTSTRMFLDGAQIGSIYSDSTNYSCGADRPLLGADANNPKVSFSQMFIDDLRITKGIARYTSNFTPPPAELPNF